VSEELPPGWMLRNGGELFGTITSGSRGWADYYAPLGARFIRVQNVRRGHIHLDLTDVQHVRPPAGAEGQRTRLRPGDVVITITADLGRVGLVPDDIGEAYVNQHVALARPRDGAMSRYLAWFLASADAQEQLGLLDRGATRAGLGLKDLAGLRIPVPPLAEQRRIVARIEALFARTRQARADLLRVGPLAKQYRDRTLACAFDADWPAASVADIAETTFDGPFGSHLKSSDYTPTGTRVVRLENIGHLHFIGDKETFISAEKGQSLARHTLQADDVLFSSFVDKEVRVCRLPRNLAGRAINKADCFCVRVDRRQALPAFVEKRLASPATYEDMREAVHGATRPRIGLSNLKAYRIGLPALETQAAIVASLDAAHGAAGRFEHEAARALALLDHLERSILTRAFRGELVPQDAADEPAVDALTEMKGSIAGAPTRRRATAPAARLMAE
jgi:type I restriction enzyme S subunit